MSTAARQGSATWAIVISGLMFMIAGAIALTFFLYPMHNAFTNAAFWSADTATGTRMLTYIGGLWEFWGGVLLITLLAYIWVNTRQ